MNTQIKAQIAADALKLAIKSESEKFQEYYQWLNQAMPTVFFEEVNHDNIMLITHNLMGFNLQDFFSIIKLKSSAIALCIDSPDADLKILDHFRSYGIKNYQTYISKCPVPFQKMSSPLRIAFIDFTSSVETSELLFSDEKKNELKNLVKLQNQEITDSIFEDLLQKMNTPFLHSQSLERLALAFHMFYRAQTRDNCQYEVRYEDDWNKKEQASMHIVLAWRNTPKHNFLYRIAEVVFRHHLIMKRVNATYIDPYSKQSVLVMSLSLHGSSGKAVWDVANIPDFLREIATVKYFNINDDIDSALVKTKFISGNSGNLLRAMINFIHQNLVHLDANLYTVENIEEALCRHPELTMNLCECFKLKFDPNNCNLTDYEEAKNKFLHDLSQLDTGQENNDIRRKNVLKQAMNFIQHTLKTNFYRMNYSALSFRLNPAYLDEIPFERSKKFPELPYAIFYMRGMHFFGYHIRFKDLSRGGLRTIYPDQIEQMVTERNSVFTECYQLAWTQHKKNKDIPEGGSKGVLFLKPFDQIDSESSIYKRELEWLGVEANEIQKNIDIFRQEQKLEYLYQSQRAFIASLITIVNCDPDGRIRAKFIVDYWNHPEYIYLGPDENMHDSMIEWIANFSKRYHYKPGGAFISSKPGAGINHKEYGVTSLGVNTYLHQMLKYLKINPAIEPFTLKMSGGPDGDVAGNELLNLYHDYPETAKLIALTDGTGTIRDDKGLNLSIIKDLFYQGKGICHYPAINLSAGGFLVHKRKKRYPSDYIQETLCWRKIGNSVVEDWLSGSDANHLLRYNVHQAKTDIFIPAGGRPRTLNETNIHEFLDETGKPTSRAIIEGANLYLTPSARTFLEEKGTLIIKDSSANKCGVICSSFEVLCGLAIDETTFIANKDTLVTEILERLKQCALREANLLLETHQLTGESLTLISEKISDRINLYTYQLLDYLDTIPLSKNEDDPMIQCFLSYCLPLLRHQFPNELLKEIPEHHIKSIIACHIASTLVYTKGLLWSPSIIEILPLILTNIGKIR